LRRKLEDVCRELASVREAEEKSTAVEIENLKADIEKDICDMKTRFEFERREFIEGLGSMKEDVCEYSKSMTMNLMRSQEILKCYDAWMRLKPELRLPIIVDSLGSVAGVRLCDELADIRRRIPIVDLSELLRCFSTFRRDVDISYVIVSVWKTYSDVRCDELFKNIEEVLVNTKLETLYFQLVDFSPKCSYRMVEFMKHLTIFADLVVQLQQPTTSSGF
jgi:hypothetical protein